MNTLPLATLAQLFCISGTLLGLPSLAVLTLYTFHVLRLWLTKPVPDAEPVKNPDAILLILDGMTRGLGAAAKFMGAISHALLSGLAVVACVVLVIAVAFFVTGRGLQTGASWARASAFLLVGVTLLTAALAALSFHGILRGAALLLVIGCALALHALWIGSTQPHLLPSPIP